MGLYRGYILRFRKVVGLLLFIAIGVSNISGGENGFRAGILLPWGGLRLEASAHSVQDLLTDQDVQSSSWKASPSRRGLMWFYCIAVSNLDPSEKVEITVC